jgi:formylglycine-generating enzyme required for sulfatase activity
MKKKILQIFLVLLCFTAQAQKVSNIRAEQREQDIVVYYYLETISSCKVSLFLSQDNGASWSGPLKNVSGDIGSAVLSGDKQIEWNVIAEGLELVGHNIKFKIIASSKEIFEPEMIFVEGGTFRIGSYSGQPDEKPTHSVSLKSFYISIFEITQSQWKEIMGVNPSYFYECGNCPVEQVSWNDVQQYIQKLAALTGKNYRLPTEAEWEYASRGGNKTQGYEFSGSAIIGIVSWCFDNSKSGTHEVGSKRPNELGIYDMSGNVWEWCSDWYSQYKTGSEINPKGPSTGQFKIVRGGSWSNEAADSRNSGRHKYDVATKVNNCGFRLVIPVN